MTHKQLASAFFVTLTIFLLIFVAWTGIKQYESNSTYSKELKAVNAVRANNSFWMALAGYPVEDLSNTTKNQVRHLRVLFDNQQHTIAEKLEAIRNVCIIQSSETRNTELWIELQTPYGYTSEKTFANDVAKAISGDLTGFIRKISPQPAAPFNHWKEDWLALPHRYLLRSLLSGYLCFILLTSITVINEPFTLLRTSLHVQPSRYEEDGNEPIWRLLCDIILAPLRIILSPILFAQDLAKYVNNDSDSQLLKWRKRFEERRSLRKNPYRATVNLLKHTIEFCEKTKNEQLMADVPALQQRLQQLIDQGPRDSVDPIAVKAILAQADMLISFIPTDGRDVPSPPAQ